MLENITLGIIQGVFEWLPVSSEGLIVLAKTHLFHSHMRFESMIKLALFLHLGTFLAALIYFHKDVIEMFTGMLKFQSQSKETQNLISFLALSTVISCGLGIVLIKTVDYFAASAESSGRLITFLVGLLLLGTAYLELKADKSGRRNLRDITISDGIILGVVQGFAVLPGFSRSGLTISTLLLRKFDKTHSLKLSFLMSLPVVLAGNIVLNWQMFPWSASASAGLACSFVFGLLTIHGLLKLAQKINFGLFVLAFGLLTILASFL